MTGKNFTVFIFFIYLRLDIRLFCLQDGVFQRFPAAGSSVAGGYGNEGFGWMEEKSGSEMTAKARKGM
jgi:hypothetical protein